MNIIRTTAVELTAIPAITYKQKLASGGAGIKIFRLDRDASAVFTIDKRTGDGIPYGKYMVNSAEYKAIIERYTNEKGKLNYTLMNKDFIQFAAKSKTVASMVADRAQPGDILAFVVKSRTTLLSGKKDSMNDAETESLIETLDEIDPRSAFKELSQYIKRLLAKRK